MCLERKLVPHARTSDTDSRHRNKYGRRTFSNILEAKKCISLNTAAVLHCIQVKSPPAM